MGFSCAAAAAVATDAVTTGAGAGTDEGTDEGTDAGTGTGTESAVKGGEGIVVESVVGTRKVFLSSIVDGVMIVEGFFFNSGSEESSFLVVAVFEVEDGAVVSN